MSLLALLDEIPNVRDIPERTVFQGKDLSYGKSKLERMLNGIESVHTYVKYPYSYHDKYTPCSKAQMFAQYSEEKSFNSTVFAAFNMNGVYSEELARRTHQLVVPYDERPIPLSKLLGH